MRLREYLTAAGMALSLSLMPSCEKSKPAKPNDVECGNNTCRDLYRDQDNGLRIPNVFKDKLVDRLEGRLGSETLIVEAYNFSGDKQPDILLISLEEGKDSSKRSKKMLYFASKYDGKITDMFFDYFKAEDGSSQADGYWDFRMNPDDEDSTIKKYFEAAKAIVDDMNSKKIVGPK